MKDTPQEENEDIRKTIEKIILDDNLRIGPLQILPEVALQIDLGRVGSAEVYSLSPW